MRKEKDKIAFFDFCGTIVPFQSADKFVKFVIANYATPTITCRAWAYRLLVGLHLIKRIEKWSKHQITSKKLILYQIKGLKESTIEEAAKQYFLQIIKPSLIPEIQTEIKKRQSEGYRIIIVSGGYNVYIKYFMEYIGGSLIDVLATPFVFSNGRFTGKMGMDCMAGNKIIYILRHLQHKNIYSVAYSDSPTDIPLFEFVDEAYFVISYPYSKKAKISTFLYQG